MNPLTREWAQKADGDFNAAKCLTQSANPARAASAKDNALADVLWAILNSSEFILNH